MKRFMLGLVCALSLAMVPACGGDDDEGDGGDGQAADSGSDGAPTAAEFCADYGTTCTFGGDGHADQAACEAAYGGYSDTRKDCVVEHLGLAADAADGSGDRTLHCGHAAGEAPCS